MTGTRGMGRRRGTRGRTVLVDGIPEGATVNPEPAYTPTQVIEMPSPELAAEVREGIEAAERGETVYPGSFEQWYDGEPVPDIGSPRAEDRTEWLRLHDGDETDFAAVLNGNPEWLYLVGLPVPPAESKAGGTGSEGREGETAASPPGAAETSSRPGGGDTEPGAKDEPAQDEPDAEPDCAEGSETA
jgi:hypothetical protein